MLTQRGHNFRLDEEQKGTSLHNAWRWKGQPQLQKEQEILTETEQPAHSEDLVGENSLP